MKTSYKLAFHCRDIQARPFPNPVSKILSLLLSSIERARRGRRLHRSTSCKQRRGCSLLSAAETRRTKINCFGSQQTHREARRRRKGDTLRLRKESSENPLEKQKTYSLFFSVTSPISAWINFLSQNKLLVGLQRPVTQLEKEMWTDFIFWAERKQHFGKVNSSEKVEKRIHVPLRTSVNSLEEFDIPGASFEDLS